MWQSLLAPENRFALEQISKVLLLPLLLLFEFIDSPSNVIC